MPTTEPLTGLVGWVVDTIHALGPFGVGLLVALENIFPPVPSEVVLPFAGFVAGREGSGPWTMVVAATLGSVIGAIVLFELGRGIGEERTRALLVRVPLVEGDEVDHAIAWFHRHGELSVLLGRMVPLVRSLVSLPAGAAHMGRVRFLALTTVGSLAWNAAWVWGGHALGQRWRQIGRFSDAINITLTVATVAVVVRFVWQRRERLGRG